MKFSRVRRWLPVSVLVGLTSLAHAHPGHDGHELTWDFSHLAQYPVATMACAAVFGGVLAVGVQALRRRSEERAQSLRVSHRNRGK